MVTVVDIKTGKAFKDDKGNIYHILDTQLTKKVSGWKGQIKYTTIMESGEMKNSRQSIETFQIKLNELQVITALELAERYNDLVGEIDQSKFLIYLYKNKNNMWYIVCLIIGFCIGYWVRSNWDGIEIYFEENYRIGHE